MKKFFTFLVLLSLVSFMNLQSQTFFAETFNGSTLPTGWHASSQASNWIVSNTNYAGGTPRELMLYWSPQFNGKTRMISPVINLTGATELIIEFLHYLNNYQGSHVIGIETTSDGGATWNLAFQKTFNSTTGSKIVEFITTPDVGSATFQFCLFYQGNSYNINYWFFDNFELFARTNTEAVMTSINNSVYNLTGSYSPSFTFYNKGISTINSVEVKYQIGDYPEITETFSSLNLQTLNTRTLSFSQTTTVAPGTYELKVEIVKVNDGADDNPANNTLLKDFITATQTTDRKVCIEHFTSSTCSPCVATNNSMKTLLANTNNEGKFSITKYQMNWPTGGSFPNGDPYYTAEGGVRRDYYRVNSVPDVYFNAKKGNVNQTTFNNALAEPAFAKINGTYYVDGNNIVIDGNMQTFTDMYKRDVRLYVIVNEKKTTGNKGNNGENEFFHVMMKMLPNGEGQKITLNAGDTYPFHHEFNMSSTNVEEMDDLEVNVFVQDYQLKYIFNSNFLSYAPPIPAPTNFEAVQVGKNVVLTWEGDAESYKLFFNGALLKDNLTENTFTYTHENVPPGVHIYGIRAVAGDSQSDLVTTSLAVCGNKPHNLEAEHKGNDVVLTWEADYAGTYSFKVFHDDKMLAENIKTKTYTHKNVVGGEHTYGVLAVIGDCPFDKVETDIEICVKPKKFSGKVEDNNVVLSWELDYGNATIFFNGDTLVENISAKQYIHENAPGGKHTYGIKAVGTNCETDIVETKVEVILGINEFNNNIKIYPNPANDFIFVEGDEIESVAVYNSMGQLILDFSVVDNVSKISTTNLSAGLYTMKIITKTGRLQTGKIIVTK